MGDQQEREERAWVAFAAASLGGRWANTDDEVCIFAYSVAEDADNQLAEWRKRYGDPEHKGESA